jgi:uncharacterized protein involved in exopolysaccharide biosynthesis
MKQSHLDTPDSLSGSYVLMPLPRQQADQHRVLKELWARKWGLIFAAIAGFVLSYLGTFLMNPVYRAETVVAPTSLESENGLMAGIQSQLGGLAALAGVGLGNAERDTQKALARLRSREFLYEFIEIEDVMTPLFENGGLLTLFRDESPDLEDAYRKFRGDVLFVAEDRRTGLVTISVDWTDGELAARWANALVGRLNADRRAAAIAEAAESVEFLEAQAEKVETVGLRGLVYRLLEAQMNEAMLAEVREEYVFRVIDPAFVPDREGIVYPRRLVLSVLASMAFLLIAAVLILAKGRTMPPPA